jgi:hypothetical protein
VRPVEGRNPSLTNDIRSTGGSIWIANDMSLVRRSNAVLASPTPEHFSKSHPAYMIG